MKKLKQVVEIKYLDNDSSKNKNYSYFCNFEVNVGDIVVVPTYKGLALAEITQIGLKVDDIDKNIVDRLKVITNKDQKHLFNMIDSMTELEDSMTELEDSMTELEE